MICKIGDNIISALGFTTDENYRQVKLGNTGLRRHEGLFGINEPAMVSLIDKQLLEKKFATLPQKNTVRYTPLEMAAILSASDAINEAGIDVSSERVLFVLSTTKGNVDVIKDNTRDDLSQNRNTQIYLWRSAQLIAEFFGNKNTPLVVSNACISGAAALLAAKQELESGRYDYAVVVGADMLCKFIISGFQSFKALSQDICKPFDAQRVGLNLGEAAATIVLRQCDMRFANNADAFSQIGKSQIVLQSGVVRNDANHISGPSRTGEGLFRALHKTLQSVDIQQIAFINAHGTATPYNDAMEEIAIARAGLEAAPVNSLKGYFGHTLGAAGILESIISARALEENTVLPTLGFETAATDSKVNVANKLMRTQKPYFVKLLSGFGGCNAALVFQK
ncbi:beta-ketoacyl synthase [Bacteroidia bacterium]|nr:beta-ketoacyl synthase [Bacteroidia bacterium]